MRIGQAKGSADSCSGAQREMAMGDAQATGDRRFLPGPSRKPSGTSRRLGYVVGIVVNAVLLYLINRSPGWQAVPFLTDDTAQVLGFVNACILAGIVSNCVYLLWDPRWLRAVGDIVTSSIGLAALVQLWSVFPFAFGAAAIDWELVARWVIGVGIAGSVIAIIVALYQLGRILPAHIQHRHL